MAKLVSHRYGKARVRVAKILRDKDRQSIVEIDVAALLEGDFESSYTSGDNTRVVPTDTIKNTINILAKEKLGDEIEPFAIALADEGMRLALVGRDRSRLKAVAAEVKRRPGATASRRGPRATYRRPFRAHEQ